METLKNACVHGKEKLLNEDYLSLPQHQTVKKNTRYVGKIYVCMFVTTVIACIVACISAIYCYRVLTEMKKIEMDKADQRHSGESLTKTTEKPIHSTPAFEIDLPLNDQVDLDYEEFDDETDETDLEEYYVEQDDEEFESDGINNEGSGQQEYQNSEHGHARTRRSDDKCKRKCLKRQGNKQKKCLKRCETGGGNSKKMMNLPSAQFEVSLTDQQIQGLVKKTHNAYINIDPCSYIDEMDGVLCSDRSYLPAKKNVSLNVFKFSAWVNQKTSPVTFDNGRAKAKTAGLYLIYAQAYLGGKEPMQSIRLVQKHGGSEVNALACMTGVHPDLNNSTSGQLQTCSVVGLLNLAEGDTIEVQKGEDTSQIILDKDKTYFGIVQLSNLASPKKKGRN